MNANESAMLLLRQNLRRAWRWLRRVLVVLLMVLVVVAGYFAVMHWRAVHQLAEATAEMDAQHPGWRLTDLEAARAKVPEDENGALIVTATAKLLPKDWPPAEIEFFKQFAEWPPNKQLTSDQSKHLREALDPLKPALAEARKLATRSTGRYPLVYERDPRTMLHPYIAEMRAVTELLTLAALLQMEDHDLSEAGYLCRAALNAGRSVGDEPLMISQMMRSACVQMAGKAVERLLGQGEGDRSDLRALQRIVEEEAHFPGLLLLYRGERAILDNTLRAVEDGDLAIGTEADNTWTERFKTFRHRDSLRLEHAALFPLLNKLVEIAELPPAERAQPLQEFRIQFDARPKDPVSQSIPALEACASSFVRRDAYLDCLTAALAAERYRRSHSDWPATLATLTPEFLKAVPLDTADGQPLSYHRLRDGVAVYSVGPDGKGQVFNPDKPSPPGEGIAVRLWNVGQRGKGD